MKLIAFVLRFRRLAQGRLGLAAALLALWPAVALADPVGSVTGLPLPRYASLKTDRVNLREGPVEGSRRPSGCSSAPACRSRSPPNSTSGARCAIRRAPRAGCCIPCFPGAARRWSGSARKAQSSRSTPSRAANGDVAATLQSGVIANVRTCDGAWCLIDGEGYKGYIEQVALWGVYPNEKIQ